MIGSQWRRHERQDPIFGYGPVGAATAPNVLSAQASRSSSRSGSGRPGLPQDAASQPATRSTAAACCAAAHGAARSSSRSACPMTASSGAKPGRRRSAISSPPRDDRRAHGVHRQSLHVRAADRPAARDHAAHRLSAEAGRELRRDPDLAGGCRARPGAGRRACARPTSTAPASRRPISATSRRRAGEGQSRLLRRLADIPHDYRLCARTIARAATTLSTRRTTAFGQAWHVPCAPTRTTARDPRARGGRARRPAPRPRPAVWALTRWALFSPLLGEFARCASSGTAHIASTRANSKRFWSDATPFVIGVREAALSFRKRPAVDPRVRAAPATRQ